VLLQSRLLIPSLSTGFEGTNKGLLSSVDSSMNEQVSRSQKGLSASMEGADVRLTSLVVSAMVINEIPLASKFSTAMVVIALESLGVGLPTLHGFCGGNFLTGKSEYFKRHDGGGVIVVTIEVVQVLFLQKSGKV